MAQQCKKLRQLLCVWPYTLSPLNTLLTVDVILRSLWFKVNTQQVAPPLFLPCLLLSLLFSSLLFLNHSIQEPFGGSQQGKHQHWGNGERVHAAPQRGVLAQMG